MPAQSSNPDNKAMQQRDHHRKRIGQASTIPSCQRSWDDCLLQPEDRVERHCKVKRLAGQQCLTPLSMRKCVMLSLKKLCRKRQIKPGNPVFPSTENDFGWASGHQYTQRKTYRSNLHYVSMNQNKACVSQNVDFYRKAMQYHLLLSLSKENLELCDHTKRISRKWLM